MSSRAFTTVSLTRAILRIIAWPHLGPGRSHGSRRSQRSRKGSINHLRCDITLVPIIQTTFGPSVR